MLLMLDNLRIIIHFLGITASIIKMRMIRIIPVSISTSVNLPKIGMRRNLRGSIIKYATVKYIKQNNPIAIPAPIKIDQTSETFFNFFRFFGRLDCLLWIRKE